MNEEQSGGRNATVLPPISKQKTGPFNDNEMFQMVTGGNDGNENKQSKTAKIWDKTTASCRSQLKRFNNFYTPVDDKYVSANVYNARDRKMIEVPLCSFRTLSTSSTTARRTRSSVSRRRSSVKYLSKRRRCSSLP